MTDPNVNSLWGRAIGEELERAGLSAACIAPGSRSTPLVYALTERSSIETFVHLDERSAGFFAVGRGKRTGNPSLLVSTSGTAAANFHPAVIEADHSRTPLLVITADRPPELQDSGANQTIDQGDLYGEAVRWHRTLPEPTVRDRTLRSLRTIVARAVAVTGGRFPGPVHLNAPFAKPLEPTSVPGEVPDRFATDHPRAADGRQGPYVATTHGRSTLSTGELDRLAETIKAADRGLIVAGPAEGSVVSPDAVVALAEATGYPVLADPLSGLRFGPHVDAMTVCGGYDAFLDEAIVDSWPAPEVVIRFGAAPTSTTLQTFLERTEGRQYVVDPAGGWRDPSFSGTDLLVCDPTWLAEELGDRVQHVAGSWLDRFADAERAYWRIVDDEPAFWEGGVVAAAVEDAPDPSTVFVSNSMPIRDLDRFARPSSKALTVLGNRGASGIDGITSTALGAASATTDATVLVTGDLAFLHDANGLLATQRFSVEITVIEINNDGGGIFERLPIAAFDPPFEQAFTTPHGLDFASLARFHGLSFERVSTVDDLRATYREALGAAGAHVVEVESDATSSHDVRDALQDRVVRELGTG